MKQRTVPRLILIALAVMAVLTLTACSQLPPAWPGLAPGDDVVYLTAAPKLYAINLANGSKKWEYERKLPASGLGALFGGSAADPLHAAPAVGENAIYVGSDGGLLIAVDKTTGVEKCKFQPELPKTVLLKTYLEIQEKPLPVYAGIAVAGKRVIFAGTADKVYAVDAATCNREWEFGAGSRVWGTPLVVSNTVYITTLGHKLIALNVENGKERWRFEEAKGALAGSPVVANGLIYVGSFDNHLYAVEAASGRLRWKFDASNWVWDGPAVAEDTLYFGDVSGNVYALDAATGQKRWDEPFQAGGAVRAMPLYADGVLYVVADNGVLHALDATSKQSVWPEGPFKPKDARFLTTPILQGEVLLLAPLEGKPTLLYGLNPADGKAKWQFNPSSK